MRYFRTICPALSTIIATLKRSPALVVTGVGAVYWKVTAKKKVRKNGRKVTLRYTSKQVGTAVTLEEAQEK